MSGKGGRAGNPQDHTDTMIGAGMRVVGDVAFTGVLRIQGDVLGDVACKSDSDGTVVVDASGCLTGALDVPRVIVRGRVIGPVRSAQSIDIQHGGTVVGDAFYREIDIHEGGIVEGLLTPTAPVESASDREGAAGRASPDRGYAVPAEGTRPTFGPGAGRMIGATALLVTAAIVALWMVRSPVAPRPADAVVAENPPAKEPAPPSAPAANARPSEARPAPEPVVASAPGADVGASSPGGGGSEDAVVTVQGVNPAKPAGAFLLVGKESAVLYRKKRQDDGEGRRIGVSAGKTVSITIGRNDIFRVAEGRDVEIFYQGRKVAPKIIESGAWFALIPQVSAAAGVER